VCLRLSLLSSLHHFHSTYTNCPPYWLCKLISFWTFACEFILILIPTFQHVPFTPKMLQARERTPTLSPSIVFTFRFAYEFFKEFGAVSLSPLVMCVPFIGVVNYYKKGHGCCRLHKSTTLLGQLNLMF